MDKTRRAFTLVELMVVVAIIGILIAITLPATNKALNRAKRLQCASNLKQLSMAVLLYCKDNKGQFPIQFRFGAGGGADTQWATLVVPYLGKKFEDWTPDSPPKDRPVFFCPNAMKHHPGVDEDAHGSYGMNSDLMVDEDPAGPPKRISSFNRTSATIMMSDGHWGPEDNNWWAGMTFSRSEYPDDFPDEPVAGRKTFVHEEGANFVYLDGHSEFLEYSNYSTNKPIWTGESPY